MTNTLKKTALVLGSIVTASTGIALSTAAAQDFGGLPTVTPQGQSDRARRQERSETERYRDRRTERPTYVVVDRGGMRADRHRQSFDTIQEAVEAVAWGGVVLVMPGIYEENITLERAVSLQGDRGPGQGVVIRPPHESAQPCLSFDPIQHNDHVLVSNITFEPGGRLMAPTAVNAAPASSPAASQNWDVSALNGRNAAVNANASGDVVPCVDVRGGIFTMVESVVDGNGSHRGDLISISGGTALLEKNRVTGGRRGITVNQDHALWDRTLLIDNIVSNNLVEGVHLDGVSNMLATGNLISANGRGLVYNGRGAATLVGNKILNNSSHGVLLDEDARQVLVRLNQIWSNQGDGIKIFSSGGLIEDNDIDGNQGVEISTIGHLDTIPTIINDTPLNRPSRRNSVSWRNRRN